MNELIQAIQSIAKALLNPFNLSIMSFTNTGTGTGTFWYMTIGPLKLLWGNTNNIAVGASANVTWGVNFPAGFFSTVMMVQATCTNMATVAELYCNVSGFSSTLTGGYLSNRVAVAGSSGISVLVVGI